MGLGYYFREKWSYLKSVLGLGFQLARANFKERYEGSYLGILWYLLYPVLLFVLLLLVFSQKLGSNIENYPVYLLIGIVLHNFFQSVTINSTYLIRNNNFIIKSINFQNESLPLASTLQFVFSHLFEIIVLACVLVFFEISLAGLLIYVPVLLLFIIFVYGCSLILSSLTVYFIDLENIWNFVARLLFFGTPILYQAKEGTLTYFINLFNPLYHFIELARSALIYTRLPEAKFILGTLISTILVLVVGVSIFKKLKPKFAEKI